MKNSVARLAARFRQHALSLTCSFIVGTLLSVAPPAGAATELPPGVSQALKNANIPLHNVGVFVQSVDSAAPHIPHNSQKPLKPASAM